MTTVKEWQVERVCPGCGKPFIPNKKKQIGCTDKDCVNKRRHPIRIIRPKRYCECCGVELKGKVKRFCSKSCGGKWRVQQSVLKKKPKYKHCQNPLCKAELTHMRWKTGDFPGWYYDWKMKFCNSSCMGEYMRQKIKNNETHFNLFQYKDGKKPNAKEEYRPKILEGNLKIVELFETIYD